MAESTTSTQSPKESPENNVTTSSSEPPTQQPSSTAPQHSRKEWKRSTNYEQEMFWFLNFFYCFYFPYTCRCDPLTEEDVPVIAEKDTTKKNYETLNKVWSPRIREYEKNKRQYDQDKLANPECVISLTFPSSLLI